ncbi:oligopeptide transporter [Musa troglodytarum]|uniref:Oligopeptide transporter n=1 Tax=Musa troglodytarum TaxID=320322 RepID=A0A9E7GEU4_9LILI|nr:oligopeptide transporter [Musa troglodytarum]
MADEEGSILDDSPIEQVRLTVPPTDDNTLQQLFYLPQVCVNIIVLIVGKLMANTLPNKVVRMPYTNWSFSLNPGPFNLKEHVVTTILAGTEGASAGLDIISMSKIFYHKDIPLLPAMLLVLSVQFLGYGFAGMFMKLLVDSPYMWWPSTLVDVSFYRALHEPEKRAKGKLSRYQFFLIVIIVIFTYSIVPVYLFPSITALSFVCWIWKDSITAQQIGSGFHGLGIGSFALDWITISSYVGSPLALPAFVVINMTAGFILILYVLLPLFYWNNVYDAKRSIWLQFVDSYRRPVQDVHTRLMKQNYEPIPRWWFYSLLFSMMGFSILVCELFNDQLQLRYWGVLLACALVVILLLPEGVMQATTGSVFTTKLLLEITFGYLQSGKPIANIAFATYCTTALNMAKFFIVQLKLAHYMKIPPNWGSGCEVGYSGAAMSHFTDLLGDPLCRVRHSPSFLLLAYANKHNHNVNKGGGLVRGRLKTVACTRFVITLTDDAPHRPHLCEDGPPQLPREGARTDAGAEDGGGPRRRGRAHRLPLPPRVAILRLTPADAEALYRRRSAATEFFHRRSRGLLRNWYSGWRRDQEKGAEYAYMATEKDNVTSTPSLPRRPSCARAP